MQEPDELGVVKVVRYAQWFLVGALVLGLLKTIVVRELEVAGFVIFTPLVLGAWLGRIKLEQRFGQWLSARMRLMSLELRSVELVLEVPADLELERVEARAEYWRATRSRQYAERQWCSDATALEARRFADRVELRARFALPDDFVVEPDSERQRTRRNWKVKLSVAGAERVTFSFEAPAPAVTRRSDETGRPASRG